MRSISVKHGGEDRSNRAHRFSLRCFPIKMQITQSTVKCFVAHRRCLQGLTPKNNTLQVMTQICFKNNSLEDPNPQRHVAGSGNPNLISISVTLADTASIIYWYHFATRKINKRGRVAGHLDLMLVTYLLWNFRLVTKLLQEKCKKNIHKGQWEIYSHQTSTYHVMPYFRGDWGCQGLLYDIMSYPWESFIGFWLDL